MYVVRPHRNSCLVFAEWWTWTVARQSIGGGEFAADRGESDDLPAGLVSAAILLGPDKCRVALGKPGLAAGANFRQAKVTEPFLFA
mgnify:CR=1 FL=1